MPPSKKRHCPARYEKNAFGSSRTEGRIAAKLFGGYASITRTRFFRSPNSAALIRTIVTRWTEGSPSGKIGADDGPFGMR